MEIIGASESLIKRRVPIVLSIVGLRDKASMKANQLSGGEQQRVVIARAMVNNPMLILADEPTGNLDPVNSESIMALLEEINYSGTTVMVCTHESSIVNRMHRRVIEISDGSLVRDEMSGEYNLATSHEKQKQKTRNAKANSQADPAAEKKRQTVHGVPFVRNINIKFSEEDGEPDEEPKPLSASETQRTDDDTSTMEPQRPDDASIETVPAAETGETDSVVSEEVKIRAAALSYYQRKVHDYQNPELKKSKNDLEEPADFQLLIKPKRIEKAAATEDLE